MEKLLAIQNKQDPDLYWSNFYGWIESDDESEIDLFTVQEAKELYLPIGGRWVEF